ncbi:MAG: hypothetical protein K2X27_20745, partial [Candidatus Obscuribacterales bacterium]|nr:hypothetical protein [Candidatus Obscuribacterales bacterium]
MKEGDKQRHTASRSFDGGNLDCGSGLLLQIREHLDLLERGELLEIISSEQSVEEDLPAWCRLTENELVSWTKDGNKRSYLVSKGRFTVTDGGQNKTTIPKSDKLLLRQSDFAKPATGQVKRLEIKPLSVLGIGSWPRPRWLHSYLEQHLEGKLSDEDFDEIADDAVKLAVLSQLNAGVDLITDGEQRRDNYASFIGNKLNGCREIPLLDLLPLVDDPAKFKNELKSLDVPADRVRHPFVSGELSRKNKIAVNELKFLQQLSNLPAKIALPGPYLLSRIMWMDCITDKFYKSREALSEKLVEILREEISDLLEAGAAIVQLDEPVLSEIVFSGEKHNRSFMCGALSERGSAKDELAFAGKLLNACTKGFPETRLAMHVCRGNWTPDETAALSGSYEALLPLFDSLSIGTLFLEYCTPRAGEIEVLKELKKPFKIGLGCVNPKSSELESVESILE